MVNELRCFLVMNKIVDIRLGRILLVYEEIIETHKDFCLILFCRIT